MEDILLMSDSEIAQFIRSKSDSEVAAITRDAAMYRFYVAIQSAISVQIPQSFPVAPRVAH